jgi:hypothetical protein
MKTQVFLLLILAFNSFQLSRSDCLYTVADNIVDLVKDLVEVVDDDEDSEIPNVISILTNICSQCSDEISCPFLKYLHPNHADAQVISCFSGILSTAESLAEAIDQGGFDPLSDAYLVYNVYEAVSACDSIVDNEGEESEESEGEEGSSEGESEGEGDNEGESEEGDSETVGSTADCSPMFDGYCGTFDVTAKNGQYCDRGVCDCPARNQQVTISRFNANTVFLNWTVEGDGSPSNYAYCSFASSGFECNYYDYHLQNAASAIVSMNNNVLTWQENSIPQCNWVLQAGN